MKKQMLFTLVVGMLLVACGQTPGVSQEQEIVVLQPGESALVVCEAAATETPEPTGTPTDTPAPPTPTGTPEPVMAWHGIVRSPENAWPTIEAELGASVVELLVRPSTSDAAILASLDDAQAQGLQVLFHIYDSSTGCDVPWDLMGGEWTISARGIEILKLVEGHPAIWAIYTLEEPWDPSSGCYADADAQRAMYEFLKPAYTTPLKPGYTTLPLYTDQGSLARGVAEGHDIGDGMCDWCCVAPTRWAAGMDEVMRRITNEYETWQATMAESQLVFMVNIYEKGSYRIPTAAGLDQARDYMCDLGVPMLYYPWVGYDRNLSDTPELWPIIAEGCGGQPVTPTPTTEATPTTGPTVTPLPTDTPAPTPTPSGSAVIVDHTADATGLTQAQLDAAREAVMFFNHKSIGNDILDGIADLQSQNPGRYSTSVQSSSGTNPGINHYQVGSTKHPLTKIDGFAPLVEDGHDLAMMKFCTGGCPCVQGDTPLGEVWAAYRDMMVAQIATHPDTAMVWWTWPLIADNHSRAYCNEELAEFNDAVRAYVAANGGYLFDIADIESHDPDGDPVDYEGWEAGWPGWTSDGAHLSEAGRQRMAGALWVLLVEVASAD